MSDYRARALAGGPCGHSGESPDPCSRCVGRRIAYHRSRAEDLEGHLERNREANRAYYQRNLEAQRARKRSDPASWYNAAARRAKRAGNRVEEVCRWDIFEKTDGRCHLCGRSIPNDIEDMTHPLFFEVDHVDPHANGGALAFDNLMPSHRLCNATRGSAELSDAIAEACREAIVPHCDAAGIY